MTATSGWGTCSVGDPGDDESPAAAERERHPWEASHHPEGTGRIGRVVGRRHERNVGSGPGVVAS